MKLKTFGYTKPNNESSVRTVMELIPSSDNMLAIDLTQLSEEERETAIDNLKQANRAFLDTIENMGLSKFYRTFKKERISTVGD